MIITSVYYHIHCLKLISRMKTDEYLFSFIPQPNETSLETKLKHSQHKEDTQCVLKHRLFALFHPHVLNDDFSKYIYHAYWGLALIWIEESSIFVLH